MSGYRLSKTAEEDLLDVWLYGVAVYGERQARRYVAGLRRAFDRLADFPELGPSLPGRSGIRTWLYGRHRVFYRPTGDGVEIGRIVHQAQDLATVLGG